MEKTDKEVLEELWEKIRKARKEKGLSQSELSEKAWIDRSYISMVERWTTNVTFLKLKKINDVLWCDILNF
ncbi:MAG: hypothetical protein ACD_78C00274G0003 [uncultured bacterium (gcode 4)]|uniref:HTH cro/C1-type domain-containing protein n=1 Tax=uncultured bacterium (gcode 4) TaxID=1234023 RepID=K1XXT8_9BACT|nr:MAG: hypothetical protein ACD_78C00274G0003 [uncultured bacterium (gcode 4)]